jgi:hypothetical protein
MYTRSELSGYSLEREQFESHQAVLKKELASLKVCGLNLSHT